MFRIINRYCLALLALTGMAGSVYAEDMFIPGPTFEYKDIKNYHPGDVSALTNEELFAHAKFMRSADMSSAQRTLNYQWLMSWENTKSEFEGNRALSKLARKAFDPYIQDLKQSIKQRMGLGDDDHANGYQAPRNEIDYDLKLSGGGLKLGVCYEF